MTSRLVQGDRLPGAGVGWARCTYAETYARIIRAANALRQLGVRPGEVVGVLREGAED